MFSITAHFKKHSFTHIYHFQQHLQRFVVAAHFSSLQHQPRSHTPFSKLDRLIRKKLICIKSFTWCNQPLPGYSNWLLLPEVLLPCINVLMCACVFLYMNKWLCGNHLRKEYFSLWWYVLSKQYFRTLFKIFSLHNSALCRINFSLISIMIEHISFLCSEVPLSTLLWWLTLFTLLHRHHPPTGNKVSWFHSSLSKSSM